MQTAAINYRVADFLKQHPPFQCIEEPDLLSLASRGRVKFHESDEFLCWQDSAYAPFFFVVQQGSVSLWEETDGREVLRDIRGAGDTIGIERFLGQKQYPYSAKTNSDVVVYALHAADFEPLLAKYPQAARYVDTYAAPGAIYRDPGRQGVHEKFVVELARHPEPLSCLADTPIAEAARILHGAGAEALAVMDGPALTGLVTVSGILGWVVSGGGRAATVAEIMQPAPPSVSFSAHVSDCVLAMTRGDTPVVALTADGTSRGGLLRLLGPSDLQPAFGDNPAVLLRDIAHASSLEAVAMQHHRARAFLLSQLESPSPLKWLSEFAGQIDAAVVKRLAALAGIADPDWLWCFWGASGRGEALTPVEPGVAILCPDAGSADEAPQVLARLRTDLSACGYEPRGEAEFGEEMLYGTLEQWRARFFGWIRDPIFTAGYAARPLLDLRPVHGDAAPWRELERAVREEVRRWPAFERLLAYDCQSILPPLTFFENAVVEDTGERTEMFALERRALGPLVELGRVFGLAGEPVLGVSTAERLAAARIRMPEQSGIFRAAEETLGVLLYLQARTGLRHSGSGAEIEPGQLSRLDRRALKTGFRAIHDLLEFAYERLWKEPR